MALSTDAITGQPNLKSSSQNENSSVFIVEHIQDDDDAWKQIYTIQQEANPGAFLSIHNDVSVQNMEPTDKASFVNIDTTTDKKNEFIIEQHQSEAYKYSVQSKVTNLYLTYSQCGTNTVEFKRPATFWTFAKQ